MLKITILALFLISLVSLHHHPIHQALSLHAPAQTTSTNSTNKPITDIKISLSDLIKKIKDVDSNKYDDFVKELTITDDALNSLQESQAKYGLKIGNPNNQCPGVSTFNRKAITQPIVTIQQSDKRIILLQANCLNCDSFKSDLNTLRQSVKSYISLVNKTLDGAFCQSKFKGEYPIGLVDLQNSYFKSNLKAKNWYYGTTTASDYKLYIFKRTTLFNLTQCPLETPFAKELVRQCFECSEDSVFNLGTQQCQTCKPDQILNIQKGSCEKCEGQKKFLQNGLVCLPCQLSEEKLFNPTSGKCYTCNKKSYLDTSIKKCVEINCPIEKPKFNKSTLQCEACQKDFIADPNDPTTCIKTNYIGLCPPEKPLYDYSLRLCKPCPNYAVYVSEKNECVVSDTKSHLRTTHSQALFFNNAPSNNTTPLNQNKSSQSDLSNNSTDNKSQPATNSDTKPNTTQPKTEDSSSFFKVNTTTASPQPSSNDSSPSQPKKPQNNVTQPIVQDSSSFFKVDPTPSTPQNTSTPNNTNNSNPVPTPNNTNISTPTPNNTNQPKIIEASSFFKVNSTIPPPQITVNTPPPPPRPTPPAPAKQQNKTQSSNATTTTTPVKIQNTTEIPLNTTNSTNTTNIASSANITNTTSKKTKTKPQINSTSPSNQSNSNCSRRQVYIARLKRCAPIQDTCNEHQFYDQYQNTCIAISTLCEIEQTYDRKLKKCVLVKQTCKTNQTYNAERNTCQLTSAACKDDEFFNDKQKICQKRSLKCQNDQLYDRNINTCIKKKFITSPYSENIIYQKNYKQLIDSYTASKKNDKSIADCPSNTPFFSKVSNSCISCPNTLKYFDILDDKCVKCPNGKIYNVATHSCIIQPADFIEAPSSVSRINI